MRRSLIALLLGISSLPAPSAEPDDRNPSPGDWPMWRYDAARSAASPDEIAASPNLLWSRKFPPVRPAWPLEPEGRLDFDASYEPVVLGKRLFLASPNDGSIAAYDTETGEEKWRFHTEGPVRCAPACWKGRVYAGSDDGYLYCLSAESGTLIWKFRGAPADRPDRRQLGNGHLVSFWPVRGGPVVADGTVCFAAGVWSIFGVFVHSLDAETGAVKWSNGGLHHVQTRIPACDKMGETGLSPQGPLVAIHDRLVVPNGRALPAGLELATGKLIYFVPGARGGGSRVSAHGEVAFVGRDRAVNLYDFRDVGCRWAYQGAQAPKGYDQDSYGHEVGLCETLYLPSKLVEGCDASSAFAEGTAYGLVRGEFRAYDLAKALTLEEKFPFYGRTERALKWEPPLRWRHQTVHEGKNGAGVIKAGKRLYGAAGRKLLALENLTGEPRIAWEKDIEGKPTSLIAADKKLFVATAEGGLYCYGEGPAGKSIPADPPLPEAKGGPWADKVRGIVESTGVKSGYGLVLGLSDGQLVEELLKQTDLQVIAVDADVKKIDALRRRCRARGLLGNRVELFAAKPFDFLFPPYLAGLIVSEDPKAGGFSSKEHAAKLYGTLRPYGGTLCLDLPQDLRAGLESWVRENAPAGGRAKSADGRSILVREGPLPGSAPWTHEFGDVARTLSSEDDLVRAPLGVLWYGDAAGAVQWKATPNRAIVSGGRLFLVEGHAGSAAIRGVDVYTGRLLWHNQEPSPTDGQLRLAALDDRVYVINDGRCRVLDAETGKTLKTFTYNAAGETAARDLRVDGEVIVIGCGEYRKEDVTSDGYWQQGYCESSTLIGLDRRSGVELWRRKARDRFGNPGIVMGAGLLFCVDSIPLYQPLRWIDHKAGRKELESTLLALDPRTGAEVWRKSLLYENRAFGTDDWLAFSAEAGLLVGGRYSLVSAWDAKTGKPAWERKIIESRGPMIVRGRTLIGALPFKDTCSAEFEVDLRTGEKTARESIIGLKRQREGCGYSTGSRHLLTQRDSSISYLDLDGGKMYHLRNIRSGCTNLLTVADGLLNAPNMGTGCVCSYPLATSFAMLSMPEVDAWAGTAPLIAVPPPARLPPEKDGKK